MTTTWKVDPAHSEVQFKVKHLITTISRKEFGLTWGGVTEAGAVVVSDEIKLQAEIQLVKQP
uniref:hypothetical protein n=1 Tax=Hymenobacter aerilatus TaxID=2932251 RepID=UPI00288010DE|nr:hypothetical protein [Hymenobacter aerilatus]